MNYFNKLNNLTLIQNIPITFIVVILLFVGRDNNFGSYKNEELNSDNYSLMRAGDDFLFEFDIAVKDLSYRTAPKLTGFSLEESHGVWTSEPEAKIELPFVAFDPVILKLCGLFFQQSYVGSVRLKYKDLSELITFDTTECFEIGMPDITQPIELHFETLTSPKKIGLSVDDRMLGIYMKKIQVRTNKESS